MERQDRKTRVDSSCSLRKRTFKFDSIPDDVLFEILLLLPLKSVFKFKCISKRWFSLISNQNFLIKKFNICSFFYEIRPIIPHGQPNHNTNKLFPVGYGFGTRFSHDEVSLEFLPQLVQNKLRLSASSNGLLLFTTIGEYHKRFHVCNPLTEEWVSLPLCLEDGKVFCQGFMCEPCQQATSRYTVLLIKKRETTRKFHVEIFSSETGKWVMHDAGPLNSLNVKLNEEKVVNYINGVLYFFVNSSTIVAYNPSYSGLGGYCTLISLPKKEDDNLQVQLRMSYGKSISCISGSEGLVFYLEVERIREILSIWVLDYNYSREQWVWNLTNIIELSDIIAGRKNKEAGVGCMKLIALNPMDRNVVFLNTNKCMLAYNILTRISQVIPLSSYPGDYQWGILPFALMPRPTPIPPPSWGTDT